MAQNLVIVESPAKMKTIQKFLGKNFSVQASGGHVRDLPKSQLGIDVDHDYEPKYITIRGKGDLLAALRKEVRKSDRVYLATDPDREGEAISWHLYQALKLGEQDKKVQRITFNEITTNAVKESLKHARKIDMDLVDAQQARRVLDRVVGYRISPVLWSKVKRGLSAGRVQSVALRLVADREAEIDAFLPEEYWTISALLDVGGQVLFAKYIGSGKSRSENISSEEEAEKIRKEASEGSFQVDEIKTGERRRKAPLPFTTSTLQQEASRLLNFSTSKTMRIAQQLYEGVEVKGSGQIGLITYLRTDSIRIAAEAEEAAKEYIGKAYGKDYYAVHGETAKKKAKVQDAHEAIRPTDVERLPASLKDSLSRDQLRLYQLIWKRFVASRMADASYDTKSVRFSVGEHHFSAAASSLKFDGFLAAYGDMETEGEEKDKTLPKGLAKDSVLSPVDVEKKQHFTSPPPHYTEASLVRALEELGIGRPSTYAPTISTILGRRYIVKEDKNLYVTELGNAVNEIMKGAFPEIVDVNFTANMEARLDGVEEGEVPWKKIIEDFYPDLDKAVKKAEEEVSKVKIEDEESDEVCEKCGRRMVIKYGPHGKFLACPGFPECRNAKPFYEKTGVACPLCGGDIVVKMSKKGRRYYGCTNNPECQYFSWQRPVNKKCPRCDSLLYMKGKYLVCGKEGCGYREQRGTTGQDQED
ncbi:MAG: type I DNA topoisomerase [Lachnospiraceae bacterium]|nr:type I DNA topoisomerase [Lachnospiraceae bacterium]